MAALPGETRAAVTLWNMLTVTDMRNERADEMVDPVAEVLPWASLELTFDRPSRVPAAVWRSATGRMLRHAVCLTRAEQCTGCTLRARCAYPAWFEPDPPGRPPPLNAADSAPAPYALHVPNAGDDEAARLRLLVTGEWALSQVALFCRAIERAAEAGLGKRRERLVLQLMSGVASASGWPRLPPGMAVDPVVVPAPPEAVVITLDSPLRLLRQKKLVEPDRLDGGLMMDALRRRFALLAWAHGWGGEIDWPDTDGVRMLDQELRVAGHMRYSARQGRTLSLTGLVGQARLQGPGLAAWWPWLWAGQYVQVGKATTQGAGAYRLLATL